MSSGSPVADGQDALAVTALVRDANGRVVPGQNVHLEADAGAQLAPADGQTDASGRRTAAVRTTQAGPVRVTASAGSATWSTQVSFVAGPADANVSRLVASPNVVTADGNAQAALSLVATDAFGNPVGQLPVHMVVDANVQLTVTDGDTDASGQFATAASCTVAGPTTVVAGAGAALVPTQLHFVAGPAAQANSSLVASPNQGVVADGNTQVQLTVQLADAFGNPAACASVALSVDAKAATPDQAGGLADAHGLWATTLCSTQPGAIDVRASSGEAELVTTVQFVADPAEPS